MARATHAGAFRVRFVSGLTALYVAFVLLVTLWPTTVDNGLDPYIEKILDRLHNHGVPGFVNYNFVEFSANILFFVPVGFLGGLALSRRFWWLSAVLGLLLSCAVEVAQATFLPGRVASPKDVLANTTGAVIGAVLAGLVRLVVMHRDRLLIRDVLEGTRDQGGTHVHGDPVPLTTRTTRAPGAP
jgi:glycopeptide antibiotics resistance protein